MLPSQGENNHELVRLNEEVEALKARCSGYERIIKDLESKSETHEEVLEMIRRQVVRLENSQGTLSTSYCGQNYDLLP
jgi:predicted  nucleic acid-binding Zn-ribbon protein